MEAKQYILKTEKGEYIIVLNDKTAQKIQRELQLNLRQVKAKIFGQ